MKVSFKILCLCALCILSTISISFAKNTVSSDAPDWVRTYFNGSSGSPLDYEGIAYIKTQGNFPTIQENATVEKFAKAAIISMIETDLHADLTTITSEKNGVVFDFAREKVDAQSHVKIRIDSSSRWFDKDERMLWARVTIPKNKVGEWTTVIDDNTKHVNVVQKHGILYRYTNGVAWIRLEEGRTLYFSTEDYITVGDRVIVTYRGNKPMQMCCENQNIQGCFRNDAGECNAQK